MKKVTLKSGVLAVWVLLSCLSISACTQAGGTEADEVLEPIGGMSLTSDTLSIWVLTNGCTLAEHFKLVVDGEPAAISVVRLKNDPCRKRTMLKQFTYDRHRLPLRDNVSYTLLNPLMLHPVPKAR